MFSVDTNDLLVFKVIAEQQSFTKAADILGLPKSNVSRKLTRLEEQLQSRLIERSTRSMHLTEIGVLLLNHCQRIDEELQAALSSIESLSESAKGTLKICTSVGVGQGLLSDLIPEFRARFPEITLDFTLTNRRVDMVEESFDLAIRVGQSPDSNLISKRLMTVNFALFASKQYIKANGMPATVSELPEHDCLQMSVVDNKSMWHLFKQNKQAHIELKTVFAADDFHMIKSMLVADQGIALMPSYLCDKEVATGELINVLPEWCGRSVDIYAIYPSRKGALPKLKVYLSFLADKF